MTSTGAGRPIRRCEANARRGTGTGTCNQPLDSHGQCPRVAEHLVDGKQARHG